MAYLKRIGAKFLKKSWLIIQMTINYPVLILNQKYSDLGSTIMSMVYNNKWIHMTMI